MRCKRYTIRLYIVELGWQLLYISVLFNRYTLPEVTANRFTGLRTRSDKVCCAHRTLITRKLYYSDIYISRDYIIKSTTDFYGTLDMYDAFSYFFILMELKLPSPVKPVASVLYKK